LEGDEDEIDVISAKEWRANKSLKI
jgi:hypothetical protein